MSLLLLYDIFLSYGQRTTTVYHGQCAVTGGLCCTSLPIHRGCVWLRGNDGGVPSERKAV